MRAPIAVRLLLAHVIAASAVAVVMAACGGNPEVSPPPASCPSIGDVVCPDQVPTYTADVQAIIVSRCYGCHGPGGIETASTNLTTYSNVVKNDLVGQVGECLMPPPDAGQLTPEERTTLFDWLECGKPQ
ncbi:MAG TPA: hypothetical protein VH044_08045 [Polyangiaceae bacterium]|jgi:uncharacterized membrane protein|nr:hypothetical protein [Polyangiaceae bacterium]